MERVNTLNKLCLLLAVVACVGCGTARSGGSDEGARGRYQFGDSSDRDPEAQQRRDEDRFQSYP